MAGNWGYKDVVPITAMVSVDCFLKGMSYFVYIAYCNVLATLVFVPLAFLSNRKKLLLPLEFPLISRICLLGLLGFSGQVCAYKGLELGSTTLASAISNLAPAFTFILAVLFRIEKVSFTSSTTQAKIIATITSISGALLIVLYKGPKVIPSSTSLSVSLQWPLESTQSNWVIGGLLEALAYLFFSFWYFVQKSLYSYHLSDILYIYPEEITVNVYYNMSVAIIALAACLIKEQNLSSWTLHPSISVVSVLYSGLFGFPFSSGVHKWGLRVKGPVFVAIFRPTSSVIAVIMSAIFLGEAVYLGSVIGGVILTIEEEMKDDGSGLSTKDPLLKSQNVEEN
ncbi:hypothetical protein ES319_A05G379900v1 [Gossypium barbadense]|uniref:WAT1-related protein n=1 Tax=Gossypium barbadense TaxID=3634 RepID=A0A5J5VZ98_GOSBA|nr:hypothetical protein ES319_A05G379900v1 [Gossypium barbadense]